MTVLSELLTYRIPVSRIILASYTLLVLVLALHHHHHGYGTTQIIAEPDPLVSGHHHAAADCPLLFYARYTFLAEEEEQPSRTVLPMVSIDVGNPAISLCLRPSQLPLTRAPPILS
ncbi:MAG: hypothetical protein KFH87_03465 [Bacteroidetes bacterium]|nr:hypothetical protein [Bacteroidota bacterium]